MANFYHLSVLQIGSTELRDVEDVLTAQDAADDHRETAHRGADADPLPELRVFHEPRAGGRNAFVAVHAEDGQDDAEDGGEANDLVGVHCTPFGWIMRNYFRILDNQRFR